MDTYNRQIKFSFQIVAVGLYCVNTNVQMTECSCEDSLYTPQTMYLRYIFENTSVKAGLHRNANAACENDAYVYVGKFVDCSAFAEVAN